jgi:hypothetical protein
LYLYVFLACILLSVVIPGEVILPTVPDEEADIEGS